MVGLLGCASAHEDAASAGGAGGNAAVGGASNENRAGASSLGGAGKASGGDTAAAGADTAAAGSGTTAAACAEHPTPQRSQGTVLALSFAPALSGKPFVFGEANALADGSSVVPINLRFYISAVQLLRSSGEPVAVDVTTANGEPEPYGVHLFNAEEDSSTTLSVLAPPGDYTGLSFALGIKLACNQQAPASLDEPLTDTSQMTWPHTGGFLFFRYEGRNTTAQGAANPASTIPTRIHMGGSIEKELVPRVSVSGVFSVPASGTLERHLTVSMDEIFSGASANIDVSDVAVGLLSSDEAIAGERLRRELPELHAFVLAP